MIYFKGGGYNILSNMAAYSIEWQEKVWPTVEHAYQAAKFDDEQIIEKIVSARSPYKAKMIAAGHEEEVRNDWHKKNVEIMEELLRAKVEQHERIREKLRESGDEELVEDTDDTFWGRGEDGNGENQLGKLWMKIRSDLLS